MVEIFISYSHKDGEITNKIAEKLKSANHKTWLDKKMQGGENIPKTIFLKIKGSDVFCIVLSPDAVRSNWVMKELSAAVKMELDYEKPEIIPIYVRNVDIPEMIYEKDYIDFVNNPFENAINDLLSTLENIGEKFSFVDTFFEDTPILSKKLLLNYIKEKYKSTIFVPLIPPPKFSHLYVYIGKIISELINQNQKVVIKWEDYSYKQLYETQYSLPHMDINTLEERMRQICSKSKETHKDLIFCKESELLSKLRQSDEAYDDFFRLKNTVKIAKNYENLKSITYYQISDDITPYNIERILFEIFAAYHPEFNIKANFIMGSFDRKTFWAQIMKIEHFKRTDVPRVLIFDKIYDIDGSLKFSLVSNSLIYPFEDDEDTLTRKALRCLAAPNAKNMVEKCFLMHDCNSSEEIVNHFLSLKK
jgi:hypothetical protein